MAAMRESFPGDVGGRDVGSMAESLLQAVRSGRITGEGKGEERKAHRKHAGSQVFTHLVVPLLQVVYQRDKALGWYGQLLLLQVVYQRDKALGWYGQLLLLQVVYQRDKVLGWYGQLLLLQVVYQRDKALEW